MSDTTKFRILSIDAWRDFDSWTWNNWFNLEIVELDDKITNRGILKFMRSEGYLNDNSKGKVLVVDDGYNIEIQDASNKMPLFALCYGEFI